MLTGMKQLLHSPWFAVSLAIIGLILGYTFVVLKQPDAFAADAFCPADYVCQGDNCDKSPGCENGKCSETCPGNCPKHT